MAKYILIIGGDGYIATMLSDILKQAGHHVTTTTRRKNISSSSNVIYYDMLHDNYDFQHYDIVIFLSAQSNKKYCQTNPDISQKINHDIPMVLCKYFAEKGSFCILFSTCEVTGGIAPFVNEYAPYQPQSIYGEHKMRLEQSALALQQDYPHIAILRLTKIYDAHADFIKNWHNIVQQQQILSLFSNIMIAPLKRDELCQIIVSVIEKKLYGLYNISGNEEMSYYDFACQIFTHNHIHAINCDAQQQQKLLLSRHNSLNDDKIREKI